MKKTASLLAFTLLASLTFQPSDGYAKSSISDIDQQIQQLENKAATAKQEQKKAAANKKEAQHYKNKTNAYLKVVMEQINVVSDELANVSLQIENTEEDLRTTKKDLQAAEERIVAREKLLESRVRLMYTDGAVSYLDVLLSSTSFSDFLTRADSLKTIVDQDQHLLDEHKKDKQLVVDKKAELDQQYAEAKSLYAQKKQRKSQLNEKEQEKQVLLASYDAKIEESEELTQEQEDVLMQIASKRSALLQEKNKLREEQAAAAAKARAEAAARAAAAAKAAAKNPTRVSMDSSSEVTYSSGNGIFSRPVSGGRISSPFGPRTHPITGVVGKMHNGVDFAVPVGSSVHAASGGIVIMAEWYSGYGYTVIVDHGGGLWTLYGHLREGGFKVSKGDTVSKGDVIAESGNTGNSTGPHLHFEVRDNGTAVNPMNYL
ncbi:murein DD-endopeptidase MepM/ murein hydrolase activator NlpD [Paenibacillus amylolyticus]|uniref:Murein DD-endopeptidase MepM/ murein hydrolase activator NlpD n=1 Tax=Paenibacillus amylolyticus TaxID=1451 RepID=A0AAP5LRG9_PAEAM|nr:MULTISPECIES: peptidoglycan DD-metalloendopeptidase family protein [Paenibacillus]MCG7379608.1 peptidoglycan DD-metalloendopeptidase family protein [Paenibacillus sp. ACRSA]MDR6726573.1 murein DD-endopeptidase MepM/ murein hydrolase activator NlpD [Paenibacillus amylolyticus]